MAHSPKTPCPFDNASVLSKITFWWLNPLFRVGYSRRLEPSDIYQVPRQDEARIVESQLTRTWNDRNSEESSSLLLTVLLAFKGVWIPPGIIIFLSESIKTIQPFLIGQLLRYFSENSDVTTTEAYVYGACLGGSALAQAVLNPLYFYLMHRGGMKMRTALAGVIYRKILTLSSKSFAKTTTGTIVNHLSTDIEIMIHAIEDLHFLWISPITIVACVYLLYTMVGLSCVFGLPIIAIVLPGQVLSGRIFGKLRLKIGSWSDKRIHLMTEILSGIRVIKMYCWEKPFSKLINSLRNKEIHFLKISFILRSLISSAGETSGRLMGMLMFVGHWLAGYPPLPLRNIFMTLGWLDVLRHSVFEYMYRGIEVRYQAAASLSRVQRFLIIDKHTPKETSDKKIVHETNNESDRSLRVSNMSATWGSNNNIAHSNPEENTSLIIDKHTPKETSDKKIVHETNNESDRSLRVSNMSATWGSNNNIAHSNPEENTSLIEMSSFCLTDISFTVNKGELVAVVGTVGSGKSSLLSVLLGELPFHQGEITMSDSLSFSAQEPWIFSGTVRQNVLFGDPLDQSRYEDVLRACALSKDVSRMPYGDGTLVGERGLLLSGGQKARITLARAVYTDRDIYLLDDPLSAVDTKVGSHIFQKCICELLKGKTRILVTHQLQYLQAVDKIVVMNNMDYIQGKILDVGNYEDFMARNLDLSTLITSSGKEDDDIDGIENSEENTDILKFSDTAEVLEDERRDSGSVGKGVYIKYLKAGRGVFYVPCILFAVAGSQMMFALSDWMLSQWVEDIHGPSSANIPVLLDNATDNNTYTTYTSMSPGNTTSSIRDWYTMSEGMRLYILALMLYIVLAVVTWLTILQMSAVASKNLHNQMFKYILGSRTKFFDENPVGRILNRFARDIGFLDSLTGPYLSIVIRNVFKFLVVVLVTLIVSPWLLIPVTPMLILICFIHHYAIQTTRDVRRLEGVARSPVYSHISDTIYGLQTIRAMKKEEQFYTDFVNYLNTHTSAWFMYISAYRWFSVRTTFTLGLYTAVVYFVCIGLGSSIPRGLLALALTYCSALGVPFEFLVRMLAELENLMTSTERIVSYTCLEQEGSDVTEAEVHPTWPTSGEVVFKNTCLGYSKDGPLVLKHLNISIYNKEKIGIVGRTGAGKSSLLSALFRLTEPGGAIIVDGVDITRIGLSQLRQKISVIPQDPVLFTGTLRTNLDPFAEFDDKMLWTCLEQVELKQKVTGTHGQLDMEVTESGTNFSVGERQLICLARALLRHNKILVLDEATANVDHRTDELIQKTIRSQFQDCTVLTIAHRLHTVMDCDRILVLDEGVVKEFDVPHILLKSEDGFLRNLLRQMGKEHEQHLLSLAEQHFEDSNPSNPTPAATVSITTSTTSSKTTSTTTCASTTVSTTISTIPL